jgi:hypothetical protein
MLNTEKNELLSSIKIDSESSKKLTRILVEAEETTQRLN